jgi:hypothetical protein
MLLLRTTGVARKDIGKLIIAVANSFQRSGRRGVV